MRQVFSNAVILEGEGLDITRGYLVVDGSKIEEISEGSPTGSSTDLNGAIVMPPFVNAHTHVGDSFGKDMYLGRRQPEVVGPKGVKFEILKLPQQKIISSMEAALEEILKSGTLAHVDFREGGLAGVNLLRKISSALLQTIVLGRGEHKGEIPGVLARADGIGLPSVDAFGESELSEISGWVRSVRKIFAMHAAETEEQNKISLKKTGENEIKRALAAKPSFIVHATHGSGEDLKLLRKNKVPVVFCPRSNNILSVGAPPISKAVELGVDFWLGTDNVMVCEPDMFEELRFAWACLRRENHRAGRDEARKLLAAATVSPTKKLGLNFGPISEGGSATFIVLARKTNLEHISDIHAGIVNRARADNIRAFFVAGKGIFNQKLR